MFGFPEISDFVQHLESLIYTTKEKNIAISPQILALADESTPLIRDLLNEKHLTDKTVIDRKTILTQKILTLEQSKHFEN
jgi:hypothetical protein